MQRARREDDKKWELVDDLNECDVCWRRGLHWTGPCNIYAFPHNEYTRDEDKDNSRSLIYKTVETDPETGDYEYLCVNCFAKR